MLLRILGAELTTFRIGSHVLRILFLILKLLSIRVLLALNNRAIHGLALLIDIIEISCRSLEFKVRLSTSSTHIKGSILQCTIIDAPILEVVLIKWRFLFVIWDCFILLIISHLLLYCTHLLILILTLRCLIRRILLTLAKILHTLPEYLVLLLLLMLLNHSGEIIFLIYSTSIQRCLLGLSIEIMIDWLSHHIFRLLLLLRSHGELCWHRLRKLIIIIVIFIFIIVIIIFIFNFIRNLIALIILYLLLHHTHIFMLRILLLLLPSCVESYLYFIEIGSVELLLSLWVYYILEKRHFTSLSDWIKL